MLSLYSVELSYNLLTLRMKELSIRSSVTTWPFVMSCLVLSLLRVSLISTPYHHCGYVLYHSGFVSTQSTWPPLYGVWNASYWHIASFLISNLYLYSFSSNWILHLLTRSIELNWLDTSPRIHGPPKPASPKPIPWFLSLKSCLPAALPLLLTKTLVPCNLSLRKPDPSQPASFSFSWNPVGSIYINSQYLIILISDRSLHPSTSSETYLITLVSFKKEFLFTSTAFFQKFQPSNFEHPQSSWL